MTLEFGFFDHMEARADVGLAQLYRERLDLLALADRLGFYGYHLAEHHNTPLSVAPSQNVFLAAAAQHTKSLRLCPLVYCLPLYHPLRLIEEIAMLDALCDGRLEVGIGRGISPLEHKFFGNDAAESADIFREAFDVLVTGLTQERLTFHGKHYDFTDVPMVLRPQQWPHPPFWYPGNLEYAATRGLNFLGGGPLRNLPAQAARYHELWEQHRDDATRLNTHISEPKIGAVKVVFVAESDAEAERVARRAFKVRAANWPKPGYESEGAGGPFHPSFNGDFDLATKVEALLTGSPATLAESLRAYDRESGMNYLVGAFQWGDLTHAEASRSLELFGEAMARVEG